MLRTRSFGVKLLSAVLGALGAVLPLIILLLDDMPYDLDALVSYAVLFGVPGFLIPFVLTRSIARIIERCTERTPTS